jgi:hypothetical protein
MGIATRPVTGVRLLKRDDMQDLCGQDINILEKELSKDEAHTGTKIAFLPSYSQACWHFARDEIMGKHLASRAPDVKGAISESGKAWMYWHYELVEKKLKVQRVVLLDRTEREGNVHELTLLLHEAVRSAFDWELTQVIIWNPCVELQEAAQALASEDLGLSVKLEERKSSSIPSLRMRGGLGPEVTWHANEYYAWC